MTLPLVYGQRVQEDIDGAYQWYESQSVGVGDDFLAALRDTLATIQATPHLYAVVHRGTRCAPLRRFPYLVYYRIEASRLLVVAVEHNRRRPGRWGSRLRGQP